MKAKKGFTLVEMSIALAVFAVVMAMVTLCFVSVQNFSKQKQQITAVIEEVEIFQTTFNSAFEDYQKSSCTLQQNTQPQNSITITTQSGSYTETISYDNQTLKQNENTLATFNTISTATFETNENLIKCTITFSDDSTQTLIFNKRI